jgi:hypothetical protein
VYSQRLHSASCQTCSASVWSPLKLAQLHLPLTDGCSADEGSLLLLLLLLSKHHVLAYAVRK